jgi:hypothetical protein
MRSISRSASSVRYWPLYLKEERDLAFGAALARFHHRVERAAEESAPALRPGSGRSQIVRIVRNAGVSHGVISGSPRTQGVSRASFCSCCTAIYVG